jgi:hypothetical protein
MTLDDVIFARAAQLRDNSSTNVISLGALINILEGVEAKLTEVIMQQDMVLRTCGTIETQLAQLQEQQERLYHGQAIVAGKLEKWPQESRPKLKVVQKRPVRPSKDQTRQRYNAVMDYCAGKVTMKELADQWYMSVAQARKLVESHAKKIGWHGRYKVGAYQAKVKAGREQKANLAHKEATGQRYEQ